MSGHKFRLLLILMAILLEACGRVTANYDAALFSCGELDRSTWAGSKALIQIVDADHGAQDATLEAKWINGQQVSTLPVSPKGCVLVPQGDGQLKVLTADHRQGLLIKPLEANPSEAVQVSLQHLVLPSLKMKCERSTVSSLTALGVTLEWMDIRPEEAWQIESMHMNILQDTRLIVKSPLSAQNFLQASYLKLPQIKIEDGRYGLSLELSTMAGNRIVAESSCPIFQLDRTAPPSTHLLHNSLSKGTDPLQLNDWDETEAVYYCISKAGESACENLNDYTVASKLVPAPAAGAYTLNSFRQDAAGNRSNRTQEPFYRDTGVPKVQIKWVSPSLPTADAWAHAPHDLYRFEADADDDSVQANFARKEDIQKSLQCRVSVIDRLGATRTAVEATCKEGACQGLSMGDWVPCPGPAAFQFAAESEYTVHGSRIMLEVRAKDSVDQLGNSQTGFWMNPTAMGSWKIDESMNLFSVHNELLFFNDRHGNVIGLTEYYWHSAGQFHPALYVRERGMEQWSAPVILYSLKPAKSWYEDLGPRPILGLNTLDPNENSVWMLQTVQTGGDIHLAEISLQNGFAVLRHQIPQTLWNLITDAAPELVAMTSFQDNQQNEHLAFLLRASPTQYVLVGFDGQTFKILSILQVPETKLLQARQMVADSYGRLILVLGQQLVIYNVNTRQQWVQSNPGIQILNHNIHGLFGLTHAGELFVMDLVPQLASASIEVLATRPRELASDQAAWSPVTHLERGDKNTFWLTGRASNTTSFLMWSFRPGQDQGWVLQNSLWGWPKQMEWMDVAAFGAEQRTGQTFVITPVRKLNNPDIPYRAMWKSISCEFVDVTEQGVYRSDVLHNPTQGVTLAQDHNGRVWRGQILANSHLAVSRLDVAEHIKTTSTEPFYTFSSELVRDPSGNFLVPTYDGKMLGFDRHTGMFQEAFALGDRYWLHTFFDSVGNFWGIDGTVDGGTIRVRIVDGSMRTIPLPGGWKATTIRPLNSNQAWVQAQSADTKSYRLFELNLVQQTLREDLPLEHPAMQIGDMINMDGRRVALVLIPDALVVPIPEAPYSRRWHLRIYEDHGQAWKPWETERQPRWPAWHRYAGHLVFTNTPGVEKLFHQADQKALWLASRLGVGQVGTLARWTADNSWQVFNPSQHNLSEYVQQILVDDQKRLVLSTRNQIFYHNPDCASR